MLKFSTTIKKNPSTSPLRFVPAANFRTLLKIIHFCLVLHDGVGLNFQYSLLLQYLRQGSI